MEEKFDLIVIGAGPGGYEAAIAASGYGMKTALIESRELGGTCLNRGCIPTKTLMHSADFYSALQKSGNLGIHLNHVTFNMQEIQSRKEEVISTLRDGIESRLRSSKVKIYHGLAKIMDNHRILLTQDEEHILEAGKILIAAGSVPAKLNIEGGDLAGVMTSDELLNQTELCQHLVIIGGGVIGMEFASLYNDFGKAVTVIEAQERILYNMDREISQNLKMILKKKGVEFHTGTMVKKISEGSQGALDCVCQEKDNRMCITADRILVAVGRQPNTLNLFSESMDISMEQGYVSVNENFQTSYNNIYAVGDVIGGRMLAHEATAQGLNAAAHMAGKPKVLRTDLIPSCVYTHPEIAAVGVTADEAKRAGKKVLVKKYIMSVNGKSVLSGEDRGFLKITVDAGSHVVIGAQFMCGRATDMIGEMAVAVANGLKMEEVGAVIHPHPTYCEGIGELLR